jgi:hypothetical protein
MLVFTEAVTQLTAVLGQFLDQRAALIGGEGLTAHRAIRPLGSRQLVNAGFELKHFIPQARVFCFSFSLLSLQPLNFCLQCRSLGQFLLCCGNLPLAAPSAQLR